MLLNVNLTTYSCTVGVTISSLEDVFLKVGEDHSVTPDEDQGVALSKTLAGIGADRSYQPSFNSQVSI